MRWEQQRRSGNIEDRRGMRIGGRGMAVGGAGLIIALIVTLLGGDPSQLLSVLGGAGDTQAQEVPFEASAEENQLADFVSAIVGSTEDVWAEQFQAMGKSYVEPRLVLFREAVESACGMAQSAVGPFYCPGDQKVYIDLAFYEDLRRQLGAPGDFAQAYVIAHEIGHHVQNLLGISDSVHQRQRGLDEAGANEMSVRLELQADFFAGVWAHHANRRRPILEEGDVEEALTAAAAIGDDRLQRQARGYVSPESFTHGTSEQRVRWFKLGLSTGDVGRGDTFATRNL
jgi:predicted metalloprotease